jgi:2-octaprenylphenol hydroxylase
MQSFDMAIMGGGMVGLALARALRNTELRIALIEPNKAKPLEASRDYGLRVSAISPVSRQFLEALGAWSGIESERYASYDQMSVWEQDSFAAIDFAASDVLAQELGVIVENDVIRAALWSVVMAQENVTLIAEPCLQVARGEREAWLSFASIGPVTARLVVGADGAHSWLRQQCDVPLTFWDYQHSALVATIETERAHQHCARQIFSPTGPLALLPLPESNLCSMVWSVTTERAKALQAMDAVTFNHALTMAFDSRLGVCRRVSELKSFPLRMRYARSFAGERFALIGDAAHTIHPLAGQGVNLGLADAKALAEHLRLLADEGRDLGLYANLRPWERARKARAQQMIAAMEFFKQTFSGTHPAKKLLRGFGMVVADAIPGLKLRWMKHALGFND